ncbi:MAG: putative Ig domain-containing protein [Acidobacteria bacterium]|nr:putative Ig domain-containing protein [Acidobacteriota bacterium]
MKSRLWQVYLLVLASTAVMTLSQAQAPLPIINSISPSSSVAEQPIALSITGSFFCTSSIVTFNGLSTPTTYMSASSLTANIPATATNGLGGSYPVQVINPPGCSVPGLSNVMFFTVTPTPFRVVTQTLPDGFIGTLYSQQFDVRGGIAPYIASSPAPLPPGLSLTASGLLVGIPTQAGVFSFTVTFRDSSAITQTISAFFTLVVKTNITILNTTLPNGTVNVFYAQTFAATGGTPPYVWSLFSGSLPPGLALSPSTGTLSGVPSQVGTFQFTVIVRDSLGQQTSKSFLLVMNQELRIQPDTLLNASVGANYEQIFTATGGLSPYTWGLSGNVPPGLTLDSLSGVLRGTPTQAGSFDITIRVTDSLGLTGARTYILVVLGGLRITTQSLADGVERTSYSQPLDATGATAPVAWRIISGALPDGLSLNSATGLISGIPTRAGISNFTLEATDSLGQRASKVFSIVIAPGIFIQTASTLPGGIVGSFYNAVLDATGGTAPYRWRLSQGLLPEGLQVNTDGVISGTPVRAGRFTFTVEVSDSASRTATAEMTIVISAPLLRITSAAQLPDATAGVDYEFTAVATGGTPPYRWSLVGAPAGLEIDAALGRIRGRLTQAGPARFAVRVSDGAQATTSQDVTVRVVLLPAPAVTILGIPATSAPGQQLNPRVSVSPSYPLPIAGELVLSFTPGAGVDDPAIQFSTGGRRTSFTIPAGQTEAVFSTTNLGIQTGTVAGTIILTSRMTASATDITPTPAPSQATQIPRQAPFISSLRVNRTANGFDLILIAGATAREISSANVRLQTTGTVQGTEFTINLTPSAGAWYQGAQSAQFGSLCSITIPFTVQGATGSVTAVTVTLANSVGASQAATANVP